MTKYRTKSVVIEAVRFEYTLNGLKDLREFVGDSLGIITKARHPGARAEAEIITLEDGIKSQVAHVATEGDWIVKGIQGEFYPIKPDIFEETYELYLRASRMTTPTTTTVKCLNCGADIPGTIGELINIAPICEDCRRTRKKVKRGV